jgi:hypothetical protein
MTKIWVSSENLKKRQMSVHCAQRGGPLLKPPKPPKYAESVCIDRRTKRNKEIETTSFPSVRLSVKFI